jgi:hypothetical protein
MKNHLFIVAFSFFLSTSLIAQTDTATTIERPCPSLFNIVKKDKTYTLRYASNHAIDVKNKNIKRLVIYIHGARRNGLDYFEWGLASVKSAGQNKKNLLIVPQFTSERDLNNHNHDKQHLFWANNSWRSGDESHSSKKRPMSETISSFSLVDSMIVRVCDKKLFPNLTQVIVIGHSAGGQFMQRYAGMTPMPNILRGVKFRFIVMNPSSYLYLDERRPTEKSGKLVFEKPDTTGCSDFNTYPKGFVNPNPYLAKVGAENFKKQLLERDVVFIMGGSDVDVNDSSMDKSCSGLMQGRFRLERGQFFYEYLQLFAPKGKVHQFGIVPNVGHSGEKMVNNPIAWKYLFEK